MNKEHLLPIKNSRLGLIGWSGFYSIDTMEFLRDLDINIPMVNPLI